MFKLAGAVVDFYDDPAFFENTEAQELLRSRLISPERLHSVPDNEFAAIIKTASGRHRKFPIYNKAATAISGQYFEKIAGDLPEDLRNAAGFSLRGAHEQYGLPLPASLSDPFDLPLTREVMLEPEIEEAAMGYDMVVKTAEYAFMSDNRGLHVLEKVQRAADIAKTAAEVGTNLEEQEVWDYVPKKGYGPMLKEALVQRETLCASDPMLKAAFEDLMDEFPSLSPQEAPFLLFELDKMAGFDSRYGLNGIIDPFMGAWGGTLLPDKQAGAKDDVLEYKLQTVARHKNMLRDALSEKFVDSFVRDPKGIYANASAGEKRLIDFLMGQVPSDDSEAKLNPADPDKIGGIWKEKEKALQTLRKEQVKPSDRPSRDNFSSSLTTKINEGL